MFRRAFDLVPLAVLPALALDALKALGLGLQCARHAGIALRVELVRDGRKAL